VIKKRRSKPAALGGESVAYHANGGAHGKLKFIDLFCGIGGFRFAFERAGCECVFSSDWNKYAQITYEANFGETPNGDIHSVAVADIPAHDILCAGFPCQPFSIAGVSKKLSLGKAHGFDDKEQGNLFFSLAEIIEFHQPAAFVLENVKNLKSHDQGRTFQIIKNTLTDALGYHLHTAVIDARSVVPQHRERIFLVGFKEQRAFEFPQFPKEGPKLESILETDVPEKYTLTDHLWEYLQAYAAKHKAAGNGFGFGLVAGKDTTRTLSARYYKDGSEILISQGPRKIRADLRLAEFLGAMFGEKRQIRKRRVVWQTQRLSSVCAKIFGNRSLGQLCFQSWRNHQSQTVVESNQSLIKGCIVET
jgi:DNA (cytosine-5)-methyltransferase 1